MTRQEALQALIHTRASWPYSYEQAVQAPDGDPGYEPDYWWHQDQKSGEVFLACEEFDSITRAEWSDARRRALNRPEVWPDAAKVLVQVPDGSWIFGTFEDAEPAGDGWRGTNPPGTWLNEGLTKGDTNIAGWHWEASLVHREDLAQHDPEEGMESFSFPQEGPVEPAETDYLEDLEDILGECLADERYRRFLRVYLGEDDISRGFAHVQIDPYRVCQLYAVGGGPREYIVKEALRGPRIDAQDEGTDFALLQTQEVIQNLRLALDRWEGMLLEDHGLTK